MITDHIHTVAAGWRGAGLLIHIHAIAVACGWWDTCLSIPVDIDIHTHVIAGVPPVNGGTYICLLTRIVLQ